MGILLSVALEAYKGLAKKFGKDTSKAVMQVALLFGAILYTVILQTAPQEYLQMFVQILGSALVFYEILWKNLQKALSNS